MFAVPSFVSERLGLLVRIQDRFLKPVVFIGTEAGGPFSPVGTGFLAQARYRNHDFTFIVTADHVIDDIWGETFAVRLNRKSGDASTITLKKENGISDKEHDIAIFSLPSLQDVYDYGALNLNRETRDSVIARVADAAVGDPVATIGLYTSHHGYTKNIPVVRSGNIAMMPDEPVLSTRGMIEAFLVETRSIAGLSGSPVFLHFPLIKVDDEGTPRLLSGAGARAFVIGMMLGYHIVETGKDQIPIPQFQGDEDTPSPRPRLDEKNTGLAVVVPFERIVDMIEHEFVRGKMDAAIDEHLSKIKVRPASVGAAPRDPVVSPPASDENPTHREDFMRLVGAAAKKRPQDEQT